jgi:hypothetical protein
MANATIDCTILHLTISVNVSSKSMPSHYSYPLATLQALNFLGFASRLGFTLKTHFALMGLLHFGRLMSFQVLFFYMESS